MMSSKLKLRGAPNCPSSKVNGFSDLVREANNNPDLKKDIKRKKRQEEKSNQRVQ